MDKQHEAQAHEALAAELDRRFYAHLPADVRTSIARYDTAVRAGEAGSEESLRRQAGWAEAEREYGEHIASRLHFGQVTFAHRDATGSAVGHTEVITPDVSWAEVFGADVIAEPGSLALPTQIRPAHEAPEYMTPRYGASDADHFGERLASDAAEAQAAAAGRLAMITALGH